jgi:hypothetical protein
MLLKVPYARIALSLFVLDGSDRDPMTSSIIVAAREEG